MLKENGYHTIIDPLDFLKFSLLGTILHANSSTMLPFDIKQNFTIFIILVKIKKMFIIHGRLDAINTFLKVGFLHASTFQNVKIAIPSFHQK
jgi:hypothetical protein